MRRLTAAKDKKDVTGVKVRRVRALVVVAALGTDSFRALDFLPGPGEESIFEDGSKQDEGSSLIFIYDFYKI